MWAELRPIAGMLRVSVLTCAAFCCLVPRTALADICSDLRSEINQAALDDTGSSLRQRRYADAARRQAAEIAKAERLHSRYNCARTISPRCDRINATMEKMKGNLATIEDQQERYTDLRSMSQLRRIRTRFEANGCDERTQIVYRDIRSVQPDETVEREYGQREASVIVRNGIGRQELRVLDTSARSRAGGSIIEMETPGTFRTLCVRTCDGYYFPVSFSTNAIYFHRDQQTCDAMCPATESRLYYHRIPEQESEDMISLAGEPYTALPSAFLYRNRAGLELDPSCTCGTPRTPVRSEAVTSVETKMTKPPAPAFADPFAGGDTLGDPETRMNEATGLTETRIRELVGGVAVGDLRNPSAQRQVRVVGSKFLPDPEEAIDLRSPVPTTGQ